MENAKPTKQAVRIQTSLLNALEKKLLVKLASIQPRWVTSDFLTGIGIFGAVVICVGYILSNYNLNWLWLSCLGFVINWYGDSMDGTLARVKHQQRPIYGYFIDHNVDSVNEALMFIGAGLSPLFDLRLALLCYSAYMVLSAYVYINAHIKNEFKLTYAALGPTEFRVVAIIMNILCIYFPVLHHTQYTWNIFDTQFEFGYLDFAAVGVWVILVIMFFVSFFKDARYFAKIDPLVKHEDEDR